MKSKTQIVKDLKYHDFDAQLNQDGWLRVTCYMDHGEEKIIEIPPEVDDCAAYVLDEIDNFDESYAAYIWLDEFGHGKCGAPYDMEDVLADQKQWTKTMQMIYKIMKGTNEMNKVTNYIVSSSNCKWRERYVLPECREHMNSLLADAEKKGYEPLLVVGKDDGMWWNDNLLFVLDRMSDGKCWHQDDPLRKWGESVDDNPLSPGESRMFETDGVLYTVLADDTDMTHGGILTNDCKPVENAKGE